MKILFLSPHKHLTEFLNSFGDEVVQYTEPLSKRITRDDGEKVDVITEATQEILKNIDFIVSYSYRFKICKEIAQMFDKRVINAHISFLPYNRGADPNFWSIAEDTPNGVSIHYVDGNIDTGDFICKDGRITRQEVPVLVETDTLRTLRNRVDEAMEKMFIEWWPLIRLGEVGSMPQLTYHWVKDRDDHLDLLPFGWDTPIKDVLGKVKTTHYRC